MYLWQTTQFVKNKQKYEFVAIELIPTSKVISKYEISLFFHMGIIHLKSIWNILIQHASTASDFKAIGL